MYFIDPLTHQIFHHREFETKQCVTAQVCQPIPHYHPLSCVLVFVPRLLCTCISYALRLRHEENVQFLMYFLPTHLYHFIRLTHAVVMCIILSQTN